MDTQTQRRAPENGAPDVFWRRAYAEISRRPLSEIRGDLFAAVLEYANRLRQFFATADLEKRLQYMADQDDHTRQFDELDREVCREAAQVLHVAWIIDGDDGERMSQAKFDGYVVTNTTHGITVTQGTRIVAILPPAVPEFPPNTLRPMDRAPRDGSDILIKSGGRFLVGHYMPGGHCIEDHPPIDAGWYYRNNDMYTTIPDPIGWIAVPTNPTS